MKKGSGNIPLYEVDRSDGKYLKLYHTLNRRKIKKKAVCREIQNEREKYNTDAKEITAKFDVFHYHCVREIKEIFTNATGYFNVNLAVNYMIDMEYKQHEFVSTSKEILWKCFGHIIIDNINRNLKTGITIRERPRMAYIKAVRGDSILDKRISERMQRKSVAITQADIDFMDNVLTTKKNGGYYSNDRELLFALLCHYKYASINDSLKNGYLQITKRKHTTVKKNGQKKKVPIRYNINAIMDMVGAKAYASSFERFADTGLVHIEEAEMIQVKMEVPYTDNDKEVFIVGDIYNPYVYLLAYEQGSKLTECVVCGKHFIKESNNQKTCNKSCSVELQKFNVAKNNEKLKILALQDTQKVI